jgi:hypothetical protein
LLEGLELCEDLYGDVVDGSGVLIQERLKPVVRGPIEVAGGKKDLLLFGREEFGAAKEVIAALGEIQIQLVSVPEYILGEDTVALCIAERGAGTTGAGGTGIGVGGWGVTEGVGTSGNARRSKAWLILCIIPSRAAIQSCCCCASQALGVGFWG